MRELGGGSRKPCVNRKEGRKGWKLFCRQNQGVEDDERTKIVGGAWEGGRDIKGGMEEMRGGGRRKIRGLAARTEQGIDLSKPVSAHWPRPR